uniref:Uncharacterized protein n=1 Tax=Mus musculus TaxID=10090 RepID=Q8BR48_MOUSE|nr:unnamed protein product [Mus musculus]
MGMYRSAFLFAHQFNPGVASIITTHRSGKTSRYSMREVGRILLKSLLSVYKGELRMPIGPLSSPPPPPPPPPHLTQDRKEMCSHCTQRLIREELPHCPCCDKPSPLYCLLAQESGCPQRVFPMGICSLLFSPVPGHLSWCQRKLWLPTLWFQLAPQAPFFSQVNNHGPTKQKKGGSFPRPNLSLGMRFRALLLL